MDRLLCLHLQGFGLFLINYFVMKMKVQMEREHIMFIFHLTNILGYKSFLVKE